MLYRLTLLILLTVGSCCYRVLGSPVVPVLPKPLRNVQIGMKISDFLRVRPSVKELNMEGKQHGHTAWERQNNLLLFEFLKHGEPMNQAMYHFKDHKLAMILLTTTRIPIKTIKRERLKVFRRLARQLGNDYELKLIERETSDVKYPAPLFVWRRGPSTVTLTFTAPLHEVTMTMGSIQMNVFSGKNADLAQYFSIQPHRNAIAKTLASRVGILPESKK